MRKDVSGRSVAAVAVLLALQGAMAAAASTASASDRNQTCEARKLYAVSDYYACLLNAGDHARRQSRCDEQFERAFGRADQLARGCPPLDDLDRTQTAVKDQAKAVLTGDISAPPCQEVLSGTDGRVTCVINKSGENIGTSASSLEDILTQITTQDPSTCAACQDVTPDTPLWLQAWGGSGGNRGEGASSGSGGFAQTVTTINDLKSLGIIDLYFYLGGGGSWNNTSGASGGAATLVTQADLQLSPSNDPTDALLIAGGGGGSGGCDGGCSLGCSRPGSGGAGGSAISTTGPDGQGIGQGSSGSSGGGSGGGNGIGGSGGGATGNADIGGTGGSGGAGAGNHSQGGPGWINTGSTPLAFTSGAGGGGNSDTNSCTAGGGGGGGGWGGGGGGRHGNIDTSAGGGGGGGSYSMASTCDDVDAPTTYQAGAGNLYLVFNTQGACK